MPCKARWLAAFTALLIVMLGEQGLLAPGVGAAAFVPLSGAGWAGNASGDTASTTTMVAPRSHSLTAVFTPADTSASSGSASAAMSVVVSAPAGVKTTKTTFLVVPSGTVLQGTPVI